VVEVGLEVDHEGALAIVRAREATLRDSPEVGALARRAAAIASGPAWRIGWILARDRAFARGLALHLARSGELDGLASHLDECCASGVFDRELFVEVQAAAGTRTNAAWQLCQSCCHERLGDLVAALRACPAGLADERQLALVDRLQVDALALAVRDASAAMTAIAALREQLVGKRDPSPAWIERRGALERHRTELLLATRATLRAKLDAREGVLAAAAFEELAEEWGEAALLYERAGEVGDRLRASQLWEKDERYGEAVRSLGPLSDRAEVKLRMAQLRDTGGDAAGAATLFEHLARWSDARRAHETAGNWLRAAQCYVEHGALGSCSADYARCSSRHAGSTTSRGSTSTSLPRRRTIAGFSTGWPRCIASTRRRSSHRSCARPAHVS
jgi:hypothetical protein